MKPPNQEGAEATTDSSREGPPTLTAIQRQQLAMAARAASERQPIGDAFWRPHSRTDRPKVVPKLILTLAIAIGLALAFTDIEQFLPVQIGKAVVAASTATHDPGQPLPSTSVPPQRLAEPVPQPAIPVSGKVVRDQPEPAQPADTSPPPVEKQAISADSLSLSVDMLSLQQQPELFPQLVQLYKERLIRDPGDAEAKNALHHLREKAFVEIENNIEANELSAATQLAKQIGQYFPDVANDPKYLALQERIAQAKPPTTTTDGAKTPLPRPRIDSLSMVSGIMESDHFVPRNDGGVLLISIGYRNFSNPPADPGDDTLTMLIRAPGNPLLLAEVPVSFSGDRGTKHFSVTTPIKENTSNNYQVDLVMRGRLLESRIVTRILSDY